MSEFAAPSAAEALSFDECEAAGVDGSGRFLDRTDENDDVAAAI